MKTAHLIFFLFVIIGLHSSAQSESSEMEADTTVYVYFNTAKHDIRLDQQRRLQYLFDNTEVATRQIRLVGHTDSHGTDDYNDALSRRRVEAVRDQLVELGVPEDRIVLDYKGEQTPLSDNESTIGRAKNRRVSIEWTYEEPSDIRDLYKLLEQKKQEFCFDPREDAVLTLDQGTVIVIPAGTYTTNCRKCLTLRAKEIYQQSDMIMENLSTTSNGRLLETGGMIYTEVIDCNGKQLSLSPGKRLSILLPTENPREDMELFYGDRDPHNDLMNWTEAQGNGGLGILSDYAMCQESFTEVLPPCGMKCGIFFCRLFGRIDETAKGAVDEEQREANKEFRKCQRNLRKYGQETRYETIEGNCDSLYAEYGVTNYAQLRDTLMKIEQQRREDAIANGQANIGELSYYTASVSRTGWMNCDAFSSAPEKDKIAMTTALNHNREEDSQLIFKNRRSAMKPDGGRSKARFSGVLPGLAVWLLHLKYSGNRIFIGLKDTSTSENGGSVRMREVTLDELKTELRKLDH